MTQVTLEAVKERQDELATLISKLEAQWKKLTFFEYQGERIALNPGETYVGTITTPGEYGSYHLIKLPEEIESATWKQALAWAEDQGGELPNRVEGALLYVTLKDEFKDAWYWTREPHSKDDYAWVQSFIGGYQNDYHKDNDYRAVAVRRLVIQ